MLNSSNLITLLLDGIPVAQTAGEGIMSAIHPDSESGEEISRAEWLKIAQDTAQKLAERRGLKLTVADRWSRGAPTKHGFYWARQHDAPKTIVRRVDGGFLVFGREQAVSDAYFEDAEFAPVE